jgi:hypothetical protein
MTDTRGRQSRQEELRTERRRRDDTTIDGGQALNLAIPSETQRKLAEQGRTARWANDVGNRMHRMTVLDDWDRVEGVDPVEVVTDVKKGKTAKSYLLSKRNDFIEEDRRRKEILRHSTEKQLLEAHIPGENANPMNAKSSTPDGLYADKANKIDRGNQLIT